VEEDSLGVKTTPLPRLQEVSQEEEEEEDEEEEKEEGNELDASRVASSLEKNRTFIEVEKLQSKDNFVSNSLPSMTMEKDLEDIKRG